jgi:hypothetical protein
LCRLIYYFPQLFHGFFHRPPRSSSSSRACRYVRVVLGMRTHARTHELIRHSFVTFGRKLS